MIRVENEYQGKTLDERNRRIAQKQEELKRIIREEADCQSKMLSEFNRRIAQKKEELKRIQDQRET